MTAAANEFQELVGVESRTEALRRYFLADLPRVNERLRALRESGLVPSARPALEQVTLSEGREQIGALYRSTWDSDLEEELVAAAHAPAFR